jgi:hypothetical protein
MSYGRWRYIAASVIGTSHEKTGAVCQDANDCSLYSLPSGEGVLVAAVADGAGTAVCGGEGAARACSTFASLVNEHLSTAQNVEQITAETARLWVRTIQSIIKNEAESVGRQVRDFACTLLGVVAGRSSAACLQIGDGAIVVADGEERVYGHVFWPDRGEYANTTHFITQEDSVEHLQFDSVRREIVEVALLSDGLQAIALNYREQSAHEPFFRGLFSPLRAVGEGRCDALSQSLESFLSSSRVNEKTDDDKTLVLATRVEDSATAQ